MRLTYVTEHWPPQLGGSAIVAERTVRHLRAVGHAVELIRPRQRDEDGCDTLDEWRTAGGAWGELPLGFATAAMLRRRWLQAGQLPQLVHVASAGPLAWAALQAARAEGIAASADVAFDLQAVRAAWPAPALLPYLRRLHALADCSFVATRSAADALAAQGFADIEVAARGVDPRAFAPHWRDGWLRRDWRALDHNPVLLFVGRLAPDTGVELALATFERLRRRNRALRMVVVGDGPLDTRLQLRHPRAQFAGWQHGTELARHFASADVLLVPGRSPCGGHVALEGMASGLAVVAFDGSGGAANLVDDVTGFVARTAGAAPAAHAAEATRDFAAAVQRALVATAPDHPLRLRARQAALRMDEGAALAALEARLRQLATQAPPLPGHALPA